MQFEYVDKRGQRVKLTLAPDGKELVLRSVAIDGDPPLRASSFPDMVQEVVGDLVMLLLEREENASDGAEDQAPGRTSREDPAPEEMHTS